MKLYISHSTNFDYQTELYAPLKVALDDIHELILPHDVKDGEYSKDNLLSSDFVIAEVSYPSTGQGIELGWASDGGVPIICMHKVGAVPSGALHHVAKETVSYADGNDMANQLTQLINK